MGSGELMTREMCAETSQRIFTKLESIEKRLFRDNGTVSIQTRIDRHEQILRVLLWVTSIIVGTVLTSGVVGLVFFVKWALMHGAAG